MTVNQRKRQRQLARKAAQASARAKAVRASATPRAAATSGFHASAHTWPVHEALISDAIRTARQGTVILSRKLGESIAVAVFLVDTGCMGIKSAFGRTMQAAAYADFLARFRGSENFVQAHPECLRKLVEGALAYAANLGFSPDPDYHSAKVLFGDLDSGDCAREFEFGENGKPFYVSGPNDSPAHIRSIMEKLSRKCGGPDGFHFMIASPSGFTGDIMDLEE
jgi:hypothetical protein